MLKYTLGATGIGLIALIIGEVTIPQQAAAGSLYSITDLGSLNPTATGFDAFSAAYGINNAGQVVGNSILPSTDIFRSNAFRTAPNSAINSATDDLGTLGGNSSTGYAINDFGQVVGESKKSVYGSDYAFLWSDATGMQNLGTLGGESSVANAINNLGQVVGSAETKEGEFHAFFYSGSGELQDLTTLGGLSSANDINDSGQIVGSKQTQSGQNHPFLYTRSGALQDLGTLGGEKGVASAINNLGQVVGSADTGATFEPNDPKECPCNVSHAFLYSGSGTLQDLGTLGGTNSDATDINDFGQIVGNADSPFFYSDGKMSNLNNLIPANSGWVLGSADGINNSGQIVGTGTIQDPERNYPVHAFLLTPVLKPTSVPEPSIILGSLTASAFGIFLGKKSKQQGKAKGII
ncbi:PEP-CTERM sorting domain-containing protein [Nostoc sp. LPT]|uniref:PEP-CTERM sorting domain-containing protein n=1 Tax=Nostoc sp. LPT TaxID=2815387 RepID=UPI001D761170|nr:PEP-CTERM sorting domain-containing protein [Nostoc sp. LPT]MBN4005747.1 PEP-CTERM sorting domain-containing protein [Nostoc sp. LPT]